MHSVLLIFHVLIAIALIGLILVQHGKGADMGAAFGSGASSTVFGARGSGSFLTTATAILALLFFSNSFLLDYLATRATGNQSIMDAAKPAGTPTTVPGGDNTEVVETKIEPVEKSTANSAATAAPKAPDDMPPIPGATAGAAGAAIGAASSKVDQPSPAPTLASGTSAEPSQATELPAPTQPTATSVPEPTVAPTVAPSPTPVVKPTEVPNKGKSKAKGKPAPKKPSKPAAKHRKD